MFEPTKLTPQQIALAENTISANAFFLIAQDRLMRRLPLSVVRMADGELRLYNEAMAAPDFDEITEMGNQPWRVRLGVEGISKREMLQRLHRAARDCDYFAPSLSGLVNPAFDLYGLFRARERYVDVFFPNAWSEEMITHLYKEARHVVLVHRNPGTAAAFTERAKKYLDVKVTWIQQESWRQTENLIKTVSLLNAPLVIASVGPAGKYTLPGMAVCGPHQKVVLDIGNTIDKYILFDTWQDALKLEAQETTV